MKNKLRPGTFGLALLALAATGCVTHRITEPPRAGDPDNQPAYHVSDKEEAVKVQLSVTSAGDDSKTLAGGTRTAATTALRAVKYQVVESGPADLDLALAATQTTFGNAADKFFTVDGAIDVRLSDLATGNVLARTTLRDRAGPELGKDAAATALSAKIGPVLDDWIRANVTPEQISLSATRVRVSQIDLHMGAEAGFIRDFVAHVSKMKGVLRCETVGVDKAGHAAEFRILWRTADFPAGLLPTIAKSFPGHAFVL